MKMNISINFRVRQKAQKPRQKKGEREREYALIKPRKEQKDKIQNQPKANVKCVEKALF